MHTFMFIFIQFFSDVDECASNSPPCSWTEGVCANTNGSYVCSCLNGWLMGKDNNSCVGK